MEIQDKHFQNLVGVLKTTSLSNDKIEITQQQLSRFLAVLLLALFLIFLSGFTLGKYRRVSCNQGDFVPSLYSILTATTDPVLPIVQKDGQVLGSEYGRFATFEEADKLCGELRKNRIISQVVMRKSFTALGKSIAHYVVCQEARLEEVTLDTALNDQRVEDLKKGVEIHD